MRDDRTVWVVELWLKAPRKWTPMRAFTFRDIAWEHAHEERRNHSHLKFRTVPYRSFRS